MDILSALELADQLGGVADAGAQSFDGVVLPPAHVERLKSSAQDWPAGETVAEFKGVKIVASPLVPDGYGIMRAGSKVIGVLNFRDGTSLTLNDEAVSVTSG